MAREIVAESRCTNLGDGKPAGRNDQHRCTKLAAAGAHHEFRGVVNSQNVGVQKCFNFRIVALGFQHIGDVLRGTVAEKLPEGFLVVRDAVLFD